MAQNHNKNSMLTLAATSSSASTPDCDNPFWSGLQVGVNISALAGTSPTLTVIVEGKDESSGVYYPLLTSAPLSAVGFTLLTIYPGVTPVANVSISQVLPKTWRLRHVIAGTSPQVTATIGASMKV